MRKAIVLKNVSFYCCLVSHERCESLDLNNYHALFINIKYIALLSFDLICENLFLREISHRRQSLRC
jgi:hypothetical protein